jgi:hypothetical protein
VDRGFFVTLGNDVMMQPCLDPETQMPPPNEGSARRAALAHAEPARLSLTRLVSAPEKRDLAFSNSLSNSARVWVRILAA